MHYKSDFIGYSGGKTDFLGFDDGTRKLPVNPYRNYTFSQVSTNLFKHKSQRNIQKKWEELDNLI